MPHSSRVSRHLYTIFSYRAITIETGPAVEVEIGVEYGLLAACSLRRFARGFFQQPIGVLGSAAKFQCLLVRLR